MIKVLEDIRITCNISVILLIIPILLIQTAPAIEISFSASNGGESVSIWNYFDVDNSVSVSETSIASFGSVGISDSRDFSGSGDLNVKQKFGGSGGYTGQDNVQAEDASSIEISSSASLSPDDLSVQQSASIKADTITIDILASDGPDESKIADSVDGVGGMEATFDGDVRLSTGHSTCIEANSSLKGCLYSLTSATGSVPKERNSNGGPCQLDLYQHAHAPGGIAIDTATLWALGFRIQPAIDAAKDGDTVNVPTGYYPEYVNINKNIALIGWNDPTANSFSLINNAVLGSGSGGITAPEVNVTPGSKIQDGILLVSPNGVVYLIGSTFYEHDITIDKSLSIEGEGPDETIVDGEQKGPIFVVGGINPNVNVVLSGMKIQKGSAVNGSGIKNYAAQHTLTLRDCEITGNIANEYGGGIYNSGTLTIENSRIDNNSADRYGGGIYNTGTVNLADNSRIHNNSATSGGGIYNSDGTVNLDNSRIDYNSADFGAGIWNYKGTVNMNNSRIDNNSAISGGGIYNTIYGTVNLNDNSRIDNNSANSSGGGIYNTIYGTVNLNDNSRIDNNSAIEGGGIYSMEGTVNLNNNSRIYNNSANVGGGIFNAGTIWRSGTVNLADNSSIHNNRAYNGGGIYSRAGTLNLDANSRVYNNSAHEGGGIFNAGTIWRSGTVNLADNSSIHNNSADFGAGIWNYKGTVNMNNSRIDSNSAYNGGGIYNSDGTVNLDNSRIYNNSAVLAGGGICSSGSGTVNLDNSSIHNNSAHDGGGIFNAGTIWRSGTVNLNYSRIDNNSAYNGGGIFNINYGTVNLNNSRIHINSAEYNGGGIYNSDSGTVNLKNIRIDYNSAEEDGGGIFNLRGTVNLNNCRIDNNTASSSGGGIYSKGLGASVNLNFGSMTNNTNYAIFNTEWGQITGKNTITFGGNTPCDTNW